MQMARVEGENNGGMPYRALRDQEAEYSRLQQENFNHKMRIDFLEEQLIRLNNGEKVFGSADLQTEVIQLRLQLEERDQQLAERDISMIQAAQTIQEDAKVTY
ncbi:hypothetical protein DVH05_017287 [Phytophthora capsici]|nr:hypothetical protein DVH05_017287 [Phytophthora capsici]